MIEQEPSYWLVWGAAAFVVMILALGDPMGVKMTAAKARAFGIKLGPRYKKGKDGKTGTDKLFCAACKAHGLPEPTFEYEFHFARRWKFDYLFDGWLAVEKVGGVWNSGHHSRGQSQIDDMEKRNHAVLLGYSVLEFTPKQFNDGSAFAFIRRVLEEQP